jgi:hypothetical protein
LLLSCAKTEASGRDLALYQVAADIAYAGIYSIWRVPVPVAAGASAPAAAEAASGVLKALGGLAGALASVAGNILVGIANKLPETIQTGLGTVQLGPITNLQEAAAAFQTLVRKYSWQKVLSAMTRGDIQASTLSGLQRDLVVSFRFLSAIGSTGLAAVDDKYIEKLLQIYRVPLESFASALHSLDSIASAVSVTSRLAQPATTPPAG